MAPGAHAATFTVNSTADEVDNNIGNGVCQTASGACTLRAAIQEANAPPAAPDLINVPAGTYLLTIPGSLENAAATGDLDITDTVTINGAGSATTIIQAGTSDTNGIDKVFSVNQLGGNASATFIGVTVRFGRKTNLRTSPNFDHFGGGIDFFGSGSPTGCGTEKLTITDSVITNNTVADGIGGGLSMQGGPVEITNSTISNNKTTNEPGGGIHYSSGNCPFTMTDSTVSGNQARGGTGEGGGLFLSQNTNGTVTISAGSEISGNTADSHGGGIFIVGAAALNPNISNSTISNNISSGANGGNARGGGIYISTINGNSTLTNVTITGNRANTGLLQEGGGIFLNLGNLDVSLSRFFNNFASTGSGLFRASTAGTVTAVNNWWGCDDFPNATGCDTVSGTTNFTPRLDLVVTAASPTINQGGTSSVTADFSKNSDMVAVAPVVLNGLPITFGATNGTMTPTSAPLAAFMATSTYTNTSCPSDPPEMVMATLDNGTDAADVTITCLTTTTTTTLPPTTTTLPPTTTTLPPTTTTLPPTTTTTMRPTTTTTMRPTTTTTMRPPAKADLAVTKTDSPDPVEVRDRLTYTVRVKNNGPGNATGVKVTDTLPARVTFVSATPSQGSCTRTGTTVTCNLGSLAADRRATVTLRVRPTAAGTITNTAKVTGNQADPTPANNSARQRTKVRRDDRD